MRGAVEHGAVGAGSLARREERRAVMDAWQRHKYSRAPPDTAMGADVSWHDASIKNK